MCMNKQIAPCFRTGDVIPASMKSTEMEQHLDFYEENATELAQELEVCRNDHRTMQYKEQHLYSSYWVNKCYDLYYLMSEVFTVDTNRVHPNLFTCMCNTDIDFVTGAVCHGCGPHTMINPCITHKIYMRDHDTYHDNYIMQ